MFCISNHIRKRQQQTLYFLRVSSTNKGLYLFVVEKTSILLSTVSGNSCDTKYQYVYIYILFEIYGSFSGTVEKKVELYSRTAWVLISYPVSF
jgi:hypothetical protein